MKLLQWNKFFKWIFLENFFLAAQIAFLSSPDRGSLISGQSQPVRRFTAADKSVIRVKKSRFLLARSSFTGPQ